MLPSIRRTIAVSTAGLRRVHTSARSRKDANYLTKADTPQYDFLKLKNDIFSDRATSKVKRPPPKEVAFMPEVTKDEQVVPHVPDVYPALDIIPPDTGLRVWKIPLLPAAKPIDVTEDGTAIAVGRRKRARAKVWLRPGAGGITVNDKPFNAYFPSWLSRDSVLMPLVLTEKLNKFSVEAKTFGGGFSGQAGAIRLAIARALIKTDPELYPPLKIGKMLTRVPAEVERKKYGRKKARKRFAWVKR